MSKALLTQFLRADQVERGPQYPPEQLVTLFGAENWELFIRDWAESLRCSYHTVECLGGSGDEGRDVVAYTDDPKRNPPWDNYQCKFYSDPLAPGDIWRELGKLCYYTFEGAFTVPREYRFVAPKDVGTKLFKLLARPQQLKDGLIAEWPQHCSEGITKKKRVPLQGALKKHVETFDFGIVGYLPVRKVIKALRSTPYHVKWFGGGLPDRPPAKTPPKAVASTETRYVRQLLDAYSDCLSYSFNSFSDLPKDGIHRRHFDRCREDFYVAESLRVFSRSTVPEGTFEALQEEISRGVTDVAESDHQDGFERVKATVKTARELPIHSNALITVLTVGDKSGICHQLANANKLIWVKK